MKEYNIKSIIDNLVNDFNEDYKIYWETEKDSQISQEYLTGKQALELYNIKSLDSKVKYVEMQYDPVDDEELEDRIVLMNIQKKKVDLIFCSIWI